MVFRIFPKNIFTISCCCTHQRFSSHLTDFPQAFSCTFDTFSLSAATLQKFSNFSNLISVIFVSIFVACLFAIVCLCFFTCFSLSLTSSVNRSRGWPLFFSHCFSSLFLISLSRVCLHVLLLLLLLLCGLYPMSDSLFAQSVYRHFRCCGFATCSYSILINNLANDFIIINQ